MWISSLEIKNIRSFETTGTIRLDRRMNILLGANNTGKSTIIRMLYLLQQPSSLTQQDIRIGKNETSGFITLEDVTAADILAHFGSDYRILPTAYMAGSRNSGIRLEVVNSSNQRSQLRTIPIREPENFIYPYLSKRKVAGYSQQINESITRDVGDTLNNLVAKVDRLATKQYTKHEEFEQACIDILGFPITTFQATNGKQAGIIVDDYNNIPLEAMGEGVPNILGLIVNLCMAQNKLFLIEEIENDIHPRALKSLLQLIIKKAEYNQFVISTHSNIVTKFLGSTPGSKIHQIRLSPYSLENRLPTATYQEVGNTPQERRGVLEDLGYELVDSDVWSGWLFLEEATAESIIIKYLIPVFVPTLEPKLRTVSTGGNSKVEDKFEDFNRLFLFTHLTPIYKNKTWVLLDGDNESQVVIQRLRDRYSTWCQDNFTNFTKRNFEEYYPASFQPRVQEVLALPHGLDKQTAKAQLVDEVMKWVAENKDDAKEEFAKSASEVIQILNKIDATI